MVISSLSDWMWTSDLPTKHSHGNSIGKSRIGVSHKKQYLWCLELGNVCIVYAVTHCPFLFSPLNTSSMYPYFALLQSPSPGLLTPELSCQFMDWIFERLFRELKMTISSWGDFLKPASKRQQCLVRVCFLSAHSYKVELRRECSTTF